MNRALALNQITLCADGSIGLQFLKQIVDGGEVVASEPHRGVVPFDGNVEQSVKLINDHLVDMGYPPIDDSMLGLIVKVDRVGKADAGIKERRAEKVAQRDAAAE